jgi:dTDP-4-dehydrorhamnose reductase
MKIAVLGDGILGSSIHQIMNWDIISRKQDGFDITKSESYYKHLIECHDGVVFTPKYNVIINCIANTNTYSDDKQSHWDVNYKGVANLVDFCNLHNIKLIHISSDYVYTNSVENASEDDIPVHGNNWYSYTKLLADAYIELKSNNYLICRGTHKPKPFPYDKAWADQIGNFDYVDCIATWIIALITANTTGLYNVGTEVKTMYELAEKTNPNVKTAFKPDNVPPNTTMNINKLKQCLLKN